ncbi:MAG TPA: thioredoxin fold domain-containing protein [Oligoflexia bacterium]|nr:thioredoxin fold domain-containing protein [Oligoflexia bacterium]HMR23933.1 thioredoxin fold domain-containing protein [Oligoflexia bacterium]
MFNFVSQYELYKKIKPAIRTIAAGLFFFSVYVYLLPQVSVFINSKKKYEIAKQTNQVQWHYEKEPAFTQAAIEKKPMIIEFFADWCLPCRQMEINTFSDKHVQETINQNYIALKVDASKSTSFSNDMMSTYRINAFPSIILFDQKQNKQKKLTGYIDAYQLKNALEFFLKD